MASEANRPSSLFLGTVINPVLQVGRSPAELIDGTRELAQRKLFKGIYIQISDNSGMVKVNAKEKFVVPILTLIGLTGNPRRAREWVNTANASLKRSRR